MQFYLSHLVSDADMLSFLQQYPIGVESITFSIADVLDHLPEELPRYQQFLKQAQPQSLSLHGPFFDLVPATYDQKLRQITQERFQAAYEVAQTLHAQRIIYHTGFVPNVYYEESWQNQSILFWQEFLADKTAEIAIHLENVLDYRPEYIKTVLTEVNHPAFSACLDLGHANVYGQCPLEHWLKVLGNQIGHVHLHNNDGTFDQHFGLTKGNISYSHYLHQIQIINPQATCTLEISSVEDMRESLEWLIKQGFLKK